jgi:glycerol uptake facilitator protein
MKMFGMEIISAFFLTVVYMALALDKRAPKSVFGFGCGAAFGMSVITIGGVTGSMLNPVRGIVPAAFFGSLDFGKMWIYLAAPLIGCVVGGCTYHWILQKKHAKNAFDNSRDLEDDE